jgi:hypothetical protein
MISIGQSGGHPEYGKKTENVGTINMGTFIHMYNVYNIHIIMTYLLRKNNFFCCQNNYPYEAVAAKKWAPCLPGFMY